MTAARNWWGLDVGGANLKLAAVDTRVASRAFALWRKPIHLAEALADLLRDVPSRDALAVTMTGELADCFANRAEGVAHIVAATMQAAGSRRVRFYRTDSRWANATEAVADFMAVAASNWHALARLAARSIGDGHGALIDIGSTTADIIPLASGVPAARGTTDFSRLQHGELLYTGVERSPLCAIARSTRLNGQTIPLAHELFATIGDAYRLLGLLPEDSQFTGTADGRPATRAASHARLARAVCAEIADFPEEQAAQLARHAQRCQLRMVVATARRALENVGSPERVIVSGQGEFLARSAAAIAWPEAEQQSLAQRLGANVSRAAPAHALAVLATEEDP